MTIQTSDLPLKDGARGPAVLELQNALRANGQIVTADGAFGPKTEDAVEAFQRDKGLTSDGIVGPMTARALGLLPPVSVPSVPPAVGSPAIALPMDALMRLFPRAQPTIVSAIFRSQGAELHRFGITNTKRRLAYFLAQAAEESGGFTDFTENLSYSAKRMTEVWPGRFPTIASAQPYERNPEKLANKVYGGRMGNGPEASGDGWRYRGRGPIQLTGKSNYRAVGGLIGVDLVGYPDLALSTEDMMLVQAGYWAKDHLNDYADRGDFQELTQAINGGLTNLAARQRELAKIEQELGRL